MIYAADAAWQNYSTSPGIDNIWGEGAMLQKNAAVSLTGTSRTRPFFGLPSLCSIFSFGAHHSRFRAPSIPPSPPLSLFPQLNYGCPAERLPKTCSEDTHIQTERWILIETRARICKRFLTGLQIRALQWNTVLLYTRWIIHAFFTLQNCSILLQSPLDIYIYTERLYPMRNEGCRKLIFKGRVAWYVLFRFFLLFFSEVSIGVFYSMANILGAFFTDVCFFTRTFVIFGDDTS